MFKTLFATNMAGVEAPLYCAGDGNHMGFIFKRFKNEAWVVTGVDWQKGIVYISRGPTHSLLRGNDLCGGTYDFRFA